MPTILGISKKGSPLSTSEKGAPTVSCKSCSREIEWRISNFSFSHIEKHPYHKVCFSCVERDDLEPVRDGWRPKEGRRVEPYTLRLLNDPKVPKRYCKDCGYLYPYLPEYFTWRTDDDEGEHKLHSYCLGCHNRKRKPWRQFKRNMRSRLSKEQLRDFPDTDEGLRLLWVKQPGLRPDRYEPKVALDASTRGLFDA